MNDSLDGALRSAASTIEIPPGDLDRVVWRGASRARRNKRFARGGTTLAVILSLLAAVNVLGSRDDSVGVQVGTAGAVRGDIAIDWARQEAPALGQLYSIDEVSGTLYTLSTAPGETAPNRRGTVWHSSNGLDWSPRDRPSDLYLSDLSAGGDRLYAAGTTPGTARTTRGKQVADPVVAWSEDGAQTWQRTRLPIDMEGIAARSSQVVGVGDPVAASERGVVTVTRVVAEPDLSALLPRGTEAPNGWATGPTGIDILKSRSPHCPSGTQGPAADDPRPLRGPDGRVTEVPCYLVEKDGDEVVSWQVEASPQEVFGVAATFTWADLHVGDDLRRAFLGVPMLSRAGDDGTFTPVEGVLPEDTVDATVISAPDGTFVLFATTPAGVQVSTSRDGTSWQPASSVTSLTSVYSARWVGDRLALFGSVDDRWLTGVVIGLPTEGWREVDLRRIAGVDRYDREVFLDGGFSSAASSSIAFTIGDLQDSKLQMLVSRDGTTWSVTSLDDLVGAPVAYASAIATSRGPIVSATLKGTSPDKPGRRVLLVGTYR